MGTYNLDVLEEFPELFGAPNVQTLILHGDKRVYRPEKRKTSSELLVCLQ
jgi:hypothetical protein